MPPRPPAPKERPVALAASAPRPTSARRGPGPTRGDDLVVYILFALVALGVVAAIHAVVTL